METLSLVSASLLCASLAVTSAHSLVHSCALSSACSDPLVLPRLRPFHRGFPMRYSVDGRCPLQS